jgi:glycosyltransferase involved in cell wall biosynthesis
MNTDLPKISIVTPSFNQTAFLERTIQSVLNQNYPNLEYIIIDGGSTDGSVEIIKKYEKHLAYWVSEKDRGQTHALNKGFQRATGEVVAWLNSDDMYCPGALEAAGNAFASDPTLDMVYGKMLIVDHNDTILRPIRSPFWWRSFVMIGMAIQPAAFWKHTLFEKYGWLDESLRFSMDFEFFCRAFRHAKSRYLPCDVIQFRSHSDQKTEVLTKVCEKETAIIRERYMKEACGVFPPSMFRKIGLLYKTTWHCLHGDFNYLGHRLRQYYERLRGKKVNWFDY